MRALDYKHCVFEIDDPDTDTNKILIVDHEPISAGKNYAESQEYCKEQGGGGRLLSLTETRVKSLKKVLVDCKIPYSPGSNTPSLQVYRKKVEWRAGLQVKHGNGNWSNGVKYAATDYQQNKLFDQYVVVDSSKSCQEAVWNTDDYFDGKLTFQPCGGLSFLCLVDKNVVVSPNMINTTTLHVAVSTTTTGQQRAIVSTTNQSTESSSTSSPQLIKNQNQENTKPTLSTKISPPAKPIRNTKQRKQKNKKKRKTAAGGKKTNGQSKPGSRKRNQGSQPGRKSKGRGGKQPTNAVDFGAGGSPSTTTFVDEISRIPTSHHQLHDNNLNWLNVHNSDKGGTRMSDVIIPACIGILGALVLVFFILLMLALIITRRRKKRDITFVDNQDAEEDNKDDDEEEDNQDGEEDNQDGEEDKEEEEDIK